MSKRCELTGKGVLAGNNVSHSNRKTKRRFLPNIQKVTLASEVFGSVNLKIATSTLRTIDKKGGLDQFLIDSSNNDLTDKAKILKSKIVKSKAVI